MSLRFCSNYTALGYKCVNFWECSPTNDILDDVQGFYGEGIIDARMVPPKQKVAAKGVFDPLRKECPGTYETCCKGHCEAPKKGTGGNSIRKSREKGLQLGKQKSNSLCPGDYIGNRPIPGICTQFAECFKGRAIIKDCPPGLHFCIHSLLCDWPRKIVCDQLDFLTNTATDDTQNDEPRKNFSGSLYTENRKAVARKEKSIEIETISLIYKDIKAMPKYL